MPLYGYNKINTGINQDIESYFDKSKLNDPEKIDSDELGEQNIDLDDDEDDDEDDENQLVDDTEQIESNQ